MERQIVTRPLPVQKSVRRDEWRGLTSCKAGVVVPIAYFPLLREDQLRGRITVQVKMAEALHTIVNPIRVKMQATLIPKSALARFDGSMETLNRSYMNQTLPGGAAAPSWFLQDTSLATLGDDDKGHPLYDALGIHYQSASNYNTDLTESYNLMVNWRRKAVSLGLPLRAWNDSTFAPAFWDSWKFDQIKPSFDAALMEGAVPVTIDSMNPARVEMGNVSGGTTGGLPHNTDLKARVNGTEAPQIPFFMDADGTMGDFAVSIPEGSYTISLANISLAEKTSAMAKLRERYSGIPDEYLVDLLMQGINVPPEDFREPVLIARGETVIGQTERYATDGASLDQSVTNGVAQLSMRLNTPSVTPGGIVLVTIEIVPEQLYERVHDLAMWHGDGTADWLPNYTRDYLDPQKVEVVPNSYADTFHSDTDGVFGYAPLNHRWQRSYARVGGRFKRPVPDAFVEDRQRIWAVEKADPSLSADFYMCPVPFPHTVFADAEADPFEIITIGETAIRGNTVFGAIFNEDDDHYEKLMADVDTGRIESVPATAAGDAVVEDVKPAKKGSGNDAASE